MVTMTYRRTVVTSLQPHHCLDTARTDYFMTTIKTFMRSHRQWPHFWKQSENLRVFSLWQYCALRALIRASLKAVVMYHLQMLNEFGFRTKLESGDDGEFSLLHRPRCSAHTMKLFMKIFENCTLAKHLDLFEMKLHLDRRPIYSKRMPMLFVKNCTNKPCSMRAHVVWNAFCNSVGEIYIRS